MWVTPGNITFMWSHVSKNCPGLYYNITSMVNCGICNPGIEVSRAKVTCFDFTIPENGTVCRLEIQSVICWETDAAVGGNRTSVSLLLKGNIN